ncbi:MAG: DUF4383 domain-containing protein [Nocardioides sp.]|uniref:DUF4383 domain-containing protein n=1 Tax=Nocardioides sp. TaxID=35761 RepID=UPI0039E545FE
MTLAQRGLLAFVILNLGYAVWGLLANPVFGPCADEPRVRVLGVDFNGWHALAGLLLFGPGLLAAPLRAWAVRWCLLAAGVLIATAVWTAFDTTPLGLLCFPHPVADNVFHLGSAAVLLACAWWVRVSAGRGGAPERGRSARR